jgi:serine/threonine protein kinase
MDCLYERLSHNFFLRESSRGRFAPITMDPPCLAEWKQDKTIFYLNEPLQTAKYLYVPIKNVVLYPIDTLDADHQSSLDDRQKPVTMRMHKVPYMKGAFVDPRWHIRSNDRGRYVFTKSKLDQREIEILQALTSNLTLIPKVKYNLEIPSEGRYCMATDYFQSDLSAVSSLTKAMTFNPQNFSEYTVYMSITRQIAEGLQYIHQRELAYLFLSTESVFINTTNEVRLFDFHNCCSSAEFAVHSKSPEFHYSSTQFHFQPPEYFDYDRFGRRNFIDYCAADIWALGIILLQMLVGTSYFSQFPQPVLFIQDWKAALDVDNHEIRAFNLFCLLRQLGIAVDDAVVNILSRLLSPSVNGRISSEELVGILNKLIK